MIKIFLNILLVLILFTGSYAQNKGIITGKVTGSRTKEPLIGVNISVIGTQSGTITDMNGNFELKNMVVGTYRLRFDYIGYESVLKTDIVVISARPTVINVEMKESIIEGQEVTVTAGYFVEEEKVQPSLLSLSREEIRRFPGGFEDVVRTVSTLPGVAINAAGGRNDLLVRGGGPSENLYIINNVEVPNINHFGTQGNSSGSLSFVNLDLVEDVTFSTGGFGAQYGDKMSSVLTLKMMDAATDNFESKWTISATQFGMDFKAPIKNRGGLIFSARKSYLDLIFKAAGLPFVPVYTDFNIIANYDISAKDQLFLIGLSAINDVDRDQSSLENRVSNAGLMDNSQYRGILGVNYRRLTGNGYLDLTVSHNLSRYRFSQLDENEQEYFNSKADERESLVKFQRYWVLSKGLGLRTGISSKTVMNDNTTAFADTIYDRSGNRLPAASLGLSKQNNTNATAHKFAAFTELDWSVNSRFEINAGIRADYFEFLNKSFYIAPRMSLKYNMISKLSLRASGGIYYQSPSYVWIVNSDNKNLKALQNRMGILGLDYLVRNDLRVAIESYFKDYHDLPSGLLPGINDYIVLSNTGTSYGGREDDFQSFGYFLLEAVGTGKAYGVEFLVQKKFSETPWYGQLSMTIGKSEVTAANGKTYPNIYDQRFIFNLSGGYILNSKWEFSTKFRYFTGAPYTPVYRPTENSVNPGEIQNLPAEYLSDRLDAGHHLDFRVDRFFNFKSSTLIIYLDIQNIYNYKIPVKPAYDFWEDDIVRTNAIGILPSIGVSMEF